MDCCGIDLSDPVYILVYRLRSGPPPPPPFPTCGQDTTVDALTCETYLPCR
jgi:hypothetical protein